MPDPAVPNSFVPLYTQVRGAEIRIGSYGVATNTCACYVPEAVAIELAPDKTFGAAPLAPNASETEAPVVVPPELDDEDSPRKRRR